MSKQLPNSAATQKPGQSSGWLARFFAGAPVNRWAAVGALVVFMAAGAILGLAVPKVKVTGNQNSRLSSIQSLVEYRDWAIGRSNYFRTHDKVFIEGEYYSSKPPMYPALGAVLYGSHFRLSGMRASQWSYPLVLVVRTFMQVLPFLVGLILAGRLLRRRVARDGVWFFGFAAFGLGTLVFGYSSDVNNHSVAALLILASFAGALKLTDDGRDAWVAVGIGFCASMATTIDLGAAVFAVGVTVFVALRGRRSHLAWLVLGALGPVFVHLQLTTKLTGSFRPFYGQGEFYRFAGSYWTRPGGLDALREPVWLYGFHALVGHHGLFSMTPVFILAIPGTVRMLRSRGNRALGSLITATVVATVLVYLFFGPRNYGGTCQGMRWFIVLVPILWYAACWYADQRYDSVWVRWCFRLLVLGGVIHAYLATQEPFGFSPWHLLLRKIGLGSLPPHNWLLQ